MTSVEKFFASIGVGVSITVLSLPMILFGILWRAWWFFPAWGWFVVPLGVPPISFWHFAGLLTGVINLLHVTPIYKETRTVDWWTCCLSLFGYPVVTWALLWWIHR